MTSVLLITGDANVEDAVRSAVPDAQLRVFPRLGVAARVGDLTNTALIVIGHDQLNTAAQLGRIGGTTATIAIAFTGPTSHSQRVLAEMAGAARLLVIPSDPTDLEWLRTHAAAA